MPDWKHHPADRHRSRVGAAGCHHRPIRNRKDSGCVDGTVTIHLREVTRCQSVGIARAEPKGPALVSLARLDFPLNPLGDFAPFPFPPGERRGRCGFHAVCDFAVLAALFLTHPSLNRHLILSLLKLDMEFFHETRMIPSESILLFLT